VKSPRFSIALALALSVAALAGCGKDNTPTGVSPTVDNTAPDAPTAVNAAANPGSGLWFLNWTASSSPSVASYEIWIYNPDPSRTNSYTLAATVPSTSTSWQLPVVGYTQTIWYLIRSVNTGGVTSSWTSPLSVTLTPAPTAGGGSDGTGSGTNKHPGDPTGE